MRRTINLNEKKERVIAYLIERYQTDSFSKILDKEIFGRFVIGEDGELNEGDNANTNIELALKFGHSLENFRVLLDDYHEDGHFNVQEWDQAMTELVFYGGAMQRFVSGEKVFEK